MNTYDSHYQGRAMMRKLDAEKLLDDRGMEQAINSYYRIPRTSKDYGWATQCIDSLETILITRQKLTHPTRSI